MVGKRKNQDADPLPGAQPTTDSGVTPGTAVDPGAAEVYTGPGARAAAGEQVAPELADTEADAELAAQDEAPMVEYTGEFGKREITVKDWQRAGINDMPVVVWSRRTGFKVPVEVFTPQALQVLRQDGNFRVP